MRCSYSASAAEPVDRVWALLRDVDSIVAALPGATLARDGDAVAGSVKCALGGAQITYRISARTEVADDERHRAVVVVTGKEARGTGTLTATLILGVHTEGAGAQVSIGGDIDATGRGATADAEAWSRVLGRLIDAAVPGSSATPPPASPPKTAPRPALAVAPDPGDFERVDSGRSRPRPEKVVGLVVAGLFLLRLLRKRRRSKET